MQVASKTVQQTQNYINRIAPAKPTTISNYEVSYLYMSLFYKSFSFMHKTCSGAYIFPIQFGIHKMKM